MENLKIRVTTEQESKEVQELFFELGYGWHGKGKLVSYSDEILSNGFGWLVLWKPPYLTNTVIQMGSGFEDCKEITLQELRDMVVLKRSNPKDANYTCDGEKKYYVTGDDVYMYVVQDEWSLCKNLTLEKAIEVWGLKPIKEEVMKESLNDKIATAEVARQEEKHSHYKKDVSHLNVIDPYRIAVLYNLHPCADHIMKKSLCAGNRGHKDTLRDIQDIIDTAERWKRMIEEDNGEI